MFFVNNSNFNLIVNAMNLVLSTKSLFSMLRESGWEAFIRGMVSFCEKKWIDIPDLRVPHIKGTCRFCQQQNFITVEHSY